MNIYLSGVVFLQTTAAGFAVILNSFLIYVIHTFTKNNLGFYKNILTIYCIFEIFYALVAVIGMPVRNLQKKYERVLQVHYITKGTFIGMTFLGPLVGTPLHQFGPTFYCLFYQIWLGFIMFNFIYRYFIVCRSGSNFRKLLIIKNTNNSRSEWVDVIKRSACFKILIGISLFAYLLASIFCSHFLCTSNAISTVGIDRKKVYSRLGSSL